LEKVKLLIESGADIYSSESNYKMAAENGHLNIIEWFMKVSEMRPPQGTEVGRFKYYKQRALGGAALNGKEEVVKYLVSKDVKLVTGHREFILREVKDKGWIEIYKLLNV
jgi:hypothetical protein